MGRQVHKVAGIPTRSGVKARPRNSDDLPTPAELRDLAKRLGGSSRRSRCGRPGRMNSPEFWLRVEAKLATASRSGRGVRFLSRDELDAVVRRLSAIPKPKKRKQSRRRSVTWGSM